MSALANLLVATFAGRPDFIALGTVAGFEPFHCPDGIDAAWLDERHLSGVQPLGFYLLDAYSMCRCACIDFDNKADHPDPEWQTKAEAVTLKLAGMGIDTLTEISQSGNGCHLWLFLDEPTDAWIPRAFLRTVAESAGVIVREVYPKQDTLSGKKIGSLVRYPLWHLSRFADPLDGWITIPSDEALSSITRYDGPHLRMVAFNCGLGDLKPPAAVTVIAEGGMSARVRELVSRPQTLLGRRWLGDSRGMNDPSGSAIALSIATELVRCHVPTPDVEAALHEWCESHDCKAYARRNQQDRNAWVCLTVAKSYEFMAERSNEAECEEHTFQSACVEYIDKLESGGEFYFPSGIQSLDESIDGIAPGEMCIVAARPSHGKSAFGIQWLDYVAGMGVPCLIVSEEMSRAAIAKRRLTSISCMPKSEWLESAQHRKFLREETETYYANRAPVWIREGCVNVDRAVSVIDQYCQVHKVQFVAVDYAQRLSGAGGSRYEQASDVSVKLTTCAKKNNVAMLAMAQLNRAIEDRDEFSPRASDIRESGQIEQDADLILMLAWPWMADKKHPDKTEYRITVAKRRNGEIRKPLIVTVWNPEKQTFGV